ncbi:hypothetical protein C8F01DRAFT_1377252 [Mycena amicta]|nr:hypothetical protein C8F01DRAFT_1377252 [Mycena amicta]
MFACIYSTSPASAWAASVPCSSSASSVTSLDMPGVWKSSYNSPGLKSSSSTTVWRSSSLFSSSATAVLGAATSECESAISASAPSFPPVASPEPVSEHSTVPLSATRMQVSSVSTISVGFRPPHRFGCSAVVQNRHTSIPSHSAVDGLDAPSAAPSPCTSISKSGIYGPRRGSTSRSTASAPDLLVAATFEPETAITTSATSSSPAAIPEPVSEHDNVTSSHLRSEIQSTAFILNHDMPVVEAEQRTASPPPSIAKSGIYGGRRGPTCTSSATVVPAAAIPHSESVITTSSSATAVPEPVSEPNTYTSSDSPMHLQSTAFVTDRDAPVAQAEATATSPPPSMAKPGIYGGRRGPTSRSTSTQLSFTSTDATTTPTPPALAPRAVPREKHMRVQVPSVRRHSTKRVGRDMTFGGMIPRGRQSSGLRIIVLVRTGMLADQRAKKLLEERAKEKEEKEARARAVMCGMLEMAREAQREERVEMMARKVQEVKRRSKGMDMEAVPAKKTQKIRIQGWQEGSETDWVMV